MKNKEILLLPKYTEKGPSSRYRLFQYVPLLRESFTISISPFFDESYIESLLAGNQPPIYSALKSFFKRVFKIIFISSKNTKLVLIEYELIPYFPSIFESLLKLKGINFLTIYDDAVFHRYDKSDNFIIKLILGNKIKNVMKKSSAVIVGNKYLEKYAINATNSKVYLLPTVVDTNLYQAKKIFSETIRIVWIGSPSTSKYLSRVDKILKNLSKDYSFEVIVIGANNFQFSDDITQSYVDYNDSNESSNLDEYDIGIMPLFDSDWEKGKCGFKLIQYMASGLPTIADNVGANSDITINGTTGFLCNSDSDWHNSLKLLMENKTLRMELGSNGVKRARKLYSLDSTKENLLGIVKESLGKN